MIRHACLFLLLSFTINITYSQRCDSILWKNERSLEWKHFRGVPVFNASVNAVSEITIGLHYEVMRKLAMFHVTCCFSTCRSWMKVFGHHQLLEHEQLHFDIAEYCRRLIIQKILEGQFSFEDIDEKVMTIRTKIDEQRIEMDQLYDLETDHSLVYDKQKDWEKKIHLLLQQTGEYNRNQCLVTLK